MSRQLVGEVHLATSDAAERSGKTARVFTINDVRFKVEQEEGAFQTDEEVLRHAPDANQPEAVAKPLFHLLAGVAERAEVPHREADQRCHRRAAIGLAFLDHPTGEHVFGADGDGAAQGHRRGGQ